MGVDVIVERHRCRHFLSLYGNLTQIHHKRGAVDDVGIQHQVDPVHIVAASGTQVEPGQSCQIRHPPAFGRVDSFGGHFYGRRVLFRDAECDNQSCDRADAGGLQDEYPPSPDFFHQIEQVDLFRGRTG